jgi:ribosome-associated heat shock protein Hsp15
MTIGRHHPRHDRDPDDVADDAAGDAADDARAAGDAAGLRLDRWLWCTRIYKSRSVAAAAVAGGHVHCNGARVKPARAVRVGDCLTVSRDGRELELTVRAIPARRGPAPEARACYAESAGSIERGARLGEARRLAALTTPRPEGRPDKKERRDLLALARRQGRR